MGEMGVRETSSVSTAVVQGTDDLPSTVAGEIDKNVPRITEEVEMIRLNTVIRSRERGTKHDNDDSDDNGGDGNKLSSAPNWAKHFICITLSNLHNLIR